MFEIAACLLYVRRTGRGNVSRNTVVGADADETRCLYVFRHASTYVWLVWLACVIRS